MSDAETHSVWMVLEVGYDTCLHYGIYSTEEKAEKVAEALRQSYEDPDPMEHFEVRRYEVDQPRRSLHLAYCVEMSPNGVVSEEKWVTFVRPDYDWESGVIGAHWWTDRSGVRAVGVDRDEAIARALEMLKHPRADR